MQTLTTTTASCCVPKDSFASQRVDANGRRRIRGFTLIESLFSIAIIGFLGAILLPHLSRFRQLTARATVHSDLKQLFVWYEIVKDDSGSYPVSLDGFPAFGSFMREDGQVKDATYNYCFQVLVSTSDHFVIEARPCHGGGDGTTVYCIDETYEIVDCGTDDGAVHDEQARMHAVQRLTFEAFHQVITSSGEDDLAQEVKPLLALDETEDFAFNVLDANLDGELAQEELLQFGQSLEDDPPLIAITRQFVRDCSSILRLDVGEYDVVSRDDLQGETAELLSPVALAEFVMDSVSKHGVAQALSQKLFAAERLESRDDLTAAAGAIRAFKHQLQAQQGKSLTIEDADILRTMVDVVFPSLAFGN